MEELKVVLLNSKKTQWAIFLGAFFFAVIPLLGHLLVDGIHLSGPMLPLQETINSKFAHKFDKAGFVGLVTFWALAVKWYFKDRKRLLGF